MDESESSSPPARRKANYVGAPAIFALESACRQVTEAFGGFGCYIVGSALERPDWRDVDVRYIMRDEEFVALFPDAVMFPDGGGCWEQDARWLLLTVSISDRLSKVTVWECEISKTERLLARLRRFLRQNAQLS